MVAVETNADLEHPTFAVIEPVRTFDNDAIADWAKRRLAPEAEVFSDGLGAFRRFEAAGHAHTVLKSAGGANRYRTFWSTLGQCAVVQT